MKKLLIVTVFAVLTGSALLSCAGKAFDDFANSVDTSSGFVGSAYNAKN